MAEQRKSALAIASIGVWCVPLLPLSLAIAIYFGELQTPTFLFINRYTQLLPDTFWTWLTFIGNGWGIFALCFPLLLLAPRLLGAGLLASLIGGAISQIIKPLLDLPRPAGVLALEDFYRIGEPLLHKAMPSGHTLTAFAVVSGIYFASDRDKRSSLWWIFIIAGFSGISRNALGAHWLTDVLAGCAIGLWSGMLGAILAGLIPEKQMAPNQIGPRLLALGGVATIYVLLTQILDSELNQSLQYACVALISITLALFIKAQKPKAI
ncbi:phosphatase PAP2 family protein [Polynucleobacter bastaniensis]|jgi:membrane-associated phospholipid phosphatase|uniref:phosphatase PAP2 family protein n=1 Tax=Polynucleobacter bastaniensis TaxID=2081039 RepID=UPI001C0E626B|nr:phosphatase PAP2 family protein [Polynucleobacter bastaniensis]MBU3597763.1 phosphatase PAP2 family protein [Polynucleobacter bastaniensis]